MTNIRTAREKLLHGEHSRFSREYADLHNTAARDSGHRIECNCKQIKCAALGEEALRL
jgi:hypothetical protein